MDPIAILTVLFMQTFSIQTVHLSGKKTIPPLHVVALTPKYADSVRANLVSRNSVRQ